MKFALPVAMLLALSAATIARADNDPYGKMRSTEAPKCNWSTMKSADYKTCKQTEEHFKKMTPDQREQHDKSVDGQRGGAKPPVEEKKK
ncbi:MAG: hypothetical protein U0136_10905 [Bdellovibrionota bacterium]